MRISDWSSDVCSSDLMCGGWTPSVHLFSHTRGKLDWNGEGEMFLPGEQAEESRSAGAGNGRFDLPAVLEDGASAGAAAAKKAGFAAEPGSYAVEGDIASAAVSSRELPSASDAARATAFVDFKTDVNAQEIRHVGTAGEH